jgi:hypothetical protein
MKIYSPFLPLSADHGKTFQFFDLQLVPSYLNFNSRVKLSWGSRELIFQFLNMLSSLLSFLGSSAAVNKSKRMGEDKSLS